MLTYLSAVPLELAHDARKYPLAGYLFAEILMLSRGRPCTATNGYFASEYHVSPRTISATIAFLQESGWISVEIKNGTVREIVIARDPRNETANANTRETDFHHHEIDFHPLETDCTGDGNEIPATVEACFAPPTKSISTGILEDNNITENENEYFFPPTQDEAEKYFSSIGYQNDVAQRFHDYYTAAGWRMGRAQMKDWRAAARCWAGNEKKNQKKHVETAAELWERIKDL